MAIVIKKGAFLHIQWFDPVLGKTKSRSTKLKDNNSNRIIVNKYAKKLQDELTRKNEDAKKFGIKKITLKDAFDHFLRINNNKHPNTIRDYMRFYDLFIKSFPEDLPCTMISKLSVEEWLLGIRSLKFAQNTIHGYGKQCNHFLNFMFEYAYTPMFRINRAIKTKPEVKEIIIFKDEDISKIFKNLPDKTSNFRTAIYILFYTGLRSSDILTITADRINLNQNLISYYSPKRKKFRTVPFHPDLKPILEKRMAEVSGCMIEYEDHVNLGRAITRYFKALKLESYYTARTFRKTFITLCRSRFNMDASVVRELVGHEHGNTTDKYYNQINMNTIKKEFKKFRFRF